MRLWEMVEIAEPGTEITVYSKVPGHDLWKYKRHELLIYQATTDEIRKDPLYPHLAMRLIQGIVVNEEYSNGYSGLTIILYGGKE